MEGLEIDLFQGRPSNRFILEDIRNKEPVSFPERAQDKSIV